MLRSMIPILATVLFLAVNAPWCVASNTAREALDAVNEAMDGATDKAPEANAAKQKTDQGTGTAVHKPATEIGGNRSSEEMSVAELRAKAESGNANCQWLLAYRYEQGDGVPKDYREAAKWYRLAAQQGDATAQWSMGCMYENGKGVKKDYAEAVRFYKLSADQGDRDGQCYYGDMLLDGKGVARDVCAAYYWLHLSMEGRAAGDSQFCFDQMRDAEKKLGKKRAAQCLSRKP